MNFAGECTSEKISRSWRTPIRIEKIYAREFRKIFFREIRTKPEIKNANTMNLRKKNMRLGKKKVLRSLKLKRGNVVCMRTLQSTQQKRESFCVEQVLQTYFSNQRNVNFSLVGFSITIFIYRNSR